MTDNDTDLLAVISQELSDADQYLDYETPLNYYLGNYPAPEDDEDEDAAASEFVSTDVADAIEWIMPQVMRSLTQSNQVVVFDPTGPEDELQAELETEYTYDVLMKENDGFIIVHQLVKDSLMQNNGHAKVFYESMEDSKTTDFTALTEQQLQTAVMDPSAEILSKTERLVMSAEGQPALVWDARIAVTTNTGQITVESVAPEDIRINANHNSINLDSARFVAHLMDKTVSDLREEGVEESIIEKLTSEDADYDSAYRFTAQGESFVDQNNDGTLDESTRTIHLAECYLYSDVNADGISEYVKVTVGGQSCPHTVIDVEELSCSPWVNTTAILMSHKWRGLSIYDRLKEIQDQKTALLQNTLENIYLQNNQRHIVVEGKATNDTVNDLMLSRPGGIIRAKTPDAVVPMATPQFSGAAFDMMQYLDTVRAGRSGVAPEGEVAPHRIGESVGSEGVARLLTAKEELVGLIVRVIAETGMKPMCIKIRDLLMRHIDAVKPYQFRGQWVQINPAHWENRTRTTIRVGTGSGDRDKQVAAITTVLGIQEKIGQLPGQVLIDDSTVFKAIDDYCKFSGLNSAVGYFVDPNSPQGQQAKQAADQQQQQQQEQQMQLQTEQLQMQKQLATAETEKANAARMNVEYKAQAEAAKFELDQIKQELKTAETAASVQNADSKLNVERGSKLIDSAIEMAKIEATTGTEQNANVEGNVRTLSR